MLGIFGADRLAKEGNARLLQGLGGLDGVDGEVEGHAEVHDGGVQDVPL
jgi:hypothetical protein